MPRLLTASLLITALITGGPGVASEQADARGFFDLPINGGSREYERLGLVPSERGVAMGLLARLIYGQSIGYAERVLAQRQLAQVIGGQSTPADEPENAAPAESTPITIPVPLTADAWRDVLEPQPKGDLFIALVSNRSALLVCAGASATDPSVRALLQGDRGLLRWLVRTAPAGFALVARSLRIVNGKVQVPGGAAAEPVWEALAVERVSRPADFIRAITSRDGGRLAWFFDTLFTIDPERFAVVMPAAPADQAIERARAFYASFRAADQNWRLEEHPFLRGAADPWMITTRLALRDGAVAAPAWTWLWEAVLDRVDIPRRDAASIPRTNGSAVSLSWLAQQISSGNPRDRRDHFDMVRFAQGVFADAGPSDELDVLVALGGYRRYRAALLTLDRMEITAPALYARVVDAARRVSDRSGRDQRFAIVTFQAALAIVERVRLMRTIDHATAERLIQTLCEAVDKDDTPTPPAVAKWITGTLVPALPSLAQPDQFSDKTAFESTILQAMAGPLTDGTSVEFVWEGLTYRVDLSAGERQRIHRVREQLQSPGLDRAILSGQASQLTEALLTLVYSPALGDPEGSALLSRDVPQRHDFGLDGGVSPRREFIPWLPPREQIGDGLPWRVGGSILGLDLGLARLALRRIDDNDMPQAPTINLNDELTLARTAMALVPRELTDAARDELVAAIERGRDRIAGADRSLPAITGLAREVQLSPALLQALPWMASHIPESIPALFGLRDMLWLGKPKLSQAELDRWGVYAEPLDARLRPEMPVSARWEDFGGRAEAGMMGTQVPDLTLRIAQETLRLKLPARVIPALLLYASQDYWHDVEARFPDDLPAMTRQALALSSSRVEDYVAALAGDGPLRAK